MALGRRKRIKLPPIPVLESYEAAVDTVLELGGGVQVRCGAMLFTGFKDGGCGVQIEDSIGGIELAIAHLSRLRQHLKGRGLVVQLDIYASVENSWMLPGGIRRRTHPGFSDVHKHFSRPKEAQDWLATREGRAVGHSHSLRWYVCAYPRRQKP